MRRVRVHAAAAEEAAEAAAWYERESPGLGADFQHAVEAALDLLEENIVPLVPVPGAVATRGVKRLLLRRFPYAVIVTEQATVHGHCIRPYREASRLLARPPEVAPDIVARSPRC